MVKICIVEASKSEYYPDCGLSFHRLVQWLEAIGREDLLEKDPKKLTNRVCSRHFSPASLKTKHLCSDAVPTLCLPNNWSDGSSNETKQPQTAHRNIICNSCNKPIIGFRYKCITCADYDLCSKCELFEAHGEHYLLRIPKPVKFSVADDLIKKWQEFIKNEQATGTFNNSHIEGSSDDDMPINKYAKNYDSGVDLTEEVKAQIRDEVTRVLSITHPDKELAKRKMTKRKTKKLIVIKRNRPENTCDQNVGTEELNSVAPEVAFADVNEITGNQIDVKDEMSNLAPLEAFLVILSTEPNESH